MNVDRIDLEMAAKESPSSNRFYRISSLAQGSGDEYADFRDLVVAMTGVPVAKKKTAFQQQRFRRGCDTSPAQFRKLALLSPQVIPKSD